MELFVLRHLVCLLVWWICASCFAQTVPVPPATAPAPQHLQPPDAGHAEAEQAEGEQDFPDAKEQEDKKKLDAFFDELEKVIQGNDDRAKEIKKMLEELRLEYADLESQLSDPPYDPELLDRMLITAQYFQSLSERRLSQDPRRMHEAMSLISDKTRDFRRANPELANKPEFRKRESELRTQAMQMNRFGGFGGQQGQSLKGIMQSLSSKGEVIDRWAPRQLRAHPGEVQGALQEAHFTLRRALRLRWNGELLTLSRDHWDSAFAGQSLNDIQTAVNHMLEKRGVQPFGSDNERENFMRMAQMQQAGQQSEQISNLGRLFQEFYAGGGRSYSGGGSSGRWSTQTSSTTISIEANPADFTLTFTELQTPRRLLRVAASAETLTIVLLGDFVHRYQQHVDVAGNAHVQLNEILDDEVLSVKAESFAELYRQNPRLIEERFFPLLEHLGIVPPHSRFDSEITQRVVELLTSNQAAVRMRFEEIAKNLDVDKFTVREAAYRELQENLGEYLPLLFEKSLDKSLSREVRARIGKLVEIGNQDGTAELDSTIGKLGLTVDSEYLSELAQTVEGIAREIVQNRVQELAQAPH